MIITLHVGHLRSDDGDIAQLILILPSSLQLIAGVQAPYLQSCVTPADLPVPVWWRIFGVTSLTRSSAPKSVPAYPSQLWGLFGRRSIVIYKG